MGLTVTLRHVYDDVVLLSSTDLVASDWQLQVESTEAQEWVPVVAKIMDAHMNWSTPDVSRWEALRRGDPTAVRETFPGARQAVPAGLPLAVMWNISKWYAWHNPRTQRAFRFRFTDPRGHHFEFSRSDLGREHVFD